MRRIVCILLAVLGSAAFMHAQSSAASANTPATTCTGTVCLSSCVVQVDNTPTCDPGCTNNRGVTELIDDGGTVMQVSNPNVCRSHMGKHVKVTFVPSEKVRESELKQQQEYQIMQIEDELRP